MIMKTIAQIYAACDGKNVYFHVGRGGHFHNAGYKEYRPGITTIQECFGEAMLIDQDEDGNELPADQWQLIDGGSGIAILTGRNDIESETGVLDWDGEYDTDIIKPVSDCTDEEYSLILKVWNADNCWDDDIARYAAVATGTPMIERMTFDGDTLRLDMYGLTENITLKRDDFKGDDPEDREEQLRGELRYYDFMERDIERVMDAVSDECWFDDDED